jgi:hypothetical protein
MQHGIAHFAGYKGECFHALGAVAMLRLVCGLDVPFKEPCANLPATSFPYRITNDTHSVSPGSVTKTRFRHC